MASFKVFEKGIVYGFSDLQSNTSAKSKARIQYVIRVGHSLAAICVIFGVCSLLAYALGIDEIYRPFSGGPATHPLTALSFILIGSATFIYPRSPRGILVQIMIVMALAICIVAIIDSITSSTWSGWFTPFNHIVEQDRANGLSNAMGLNTSLMLIANGLAVLSGKRNKGMLSQFFAFIGLGFPLVSVTGYAYGITGFYGQMSILTTSFGLLISVSTLSLNANLGAIYALLAPHIGGRIARTQATLGYAVPFLLGYLFIQSVVRSGFENLFGVYVIAVCWFVVLLVTISAVAFEKVDIQRRQAESALLDAATHDALTTLPNRRKFFEAANDELNRINRNQTTAWLLMIDLDHFKQINDRAGHQIGDSVLVSTAELLSRSVRATDHLCRLGGEEFAVLLPNINHSGALQVAEKIRVAMHTMTVPGYTELYGSVTTSIGVASLDPLGSVEQSMANADKALYEAKSAGRNKIVMSEPKREALLS